MSDPVTAPRETGVSYDTLPRHLKLMMPRDEWDAKSAIGQCNFLIGFTDGALATPRTVEVTEGMVEEPEAMLLPEFYETVRHHFDYLAYHRLSDEALCGVWSRYADTLRARVAALRAQPAGETVAWLLTFAVEQVIDGSPRPTWVKGFALVNVRDLGSTHPFATRPTLRPVPTHDHNEAMRFVRKRDAEAALSALEGTSYAALLKAEEHMWCDRTYPVAAPVADAGGTP